MVCNYINNTLFNLGHAYIINNLALWKVIDDIIELDECSVYSFNPDNDSDPNAEDGAMYVTLILLFVKLQKNNSYFFGILFQIISSNLHGPLYIQAHLLT
jgi:hypothetical protein